MGWAEHPSNLTENDLEVGFEPTTSQLTCASRVSCVCVCPQAPQKGQPAAGAVAGEQPATGCERGRPLGPGLQVHLLLLPALREELLRDSRLQVANETLNEAPNEGSPPSPCGETGWTFKWIPPGWG